MAHVRMFKMPFRTNHFNLNQRVWVRYGTGAMACLVTGKYRGSGRYVEAWVNWDRKNREKYPVPVWQRIEVADEFAKRHDLADMGPVTISQDS